VSDINTTKIVAITHPLIEGVDTADQFIAYAARVSNPSNQINTETSEKLLRYCIRNSHWSIFEMVNVVMEINTTRDIARQILRHRSFNFQEYSQRYSDPTSELGFATREARLQDNKNRQNSIEINDPELQQWWTMGQRDVWYYALGVYENALRKGIAKEQARSVLPEGLTVSRMYMNGTLRSWIHYCELRMGNGTQKEHRLVAESAWNNLALYFKFLTDKT
jgi:thymidylate synthase (FAD)